MASLKAAEYEYYVRFSEPSAPSTFYPLGTTLGRSTSSADTPASTAVPPSLDALPTFQLSIFDGIDPVLNPRNSIGSVVLRDPNGLLDTYASSVTDGGIMELRRGASSVILNAFSLVATFSTAGMAYSHDTKEFRLQNLNRLLETAPLHEERYTGAGGIDGDATLEGILKPYCAGRNWRVPAVLINAASQIYQVSCTPIEAIDSVEEGGASLTFSGNDRADYAALAAATITPGFYDTCLALGLFRLGASPFYDITATVKGDKTGGTYVEKRGEIAERILTRSGVVLTSGQISSAALTVLNGAKPEPCGFYWGEEITKAAALTEIMEGILGYWFVRIADGVLVLGYLTAPIAADVTYTFATQTGLPAMTESVRQPRWKTSVSYQRNNSIRDRSRISGIVPDALASVYAQDAQWASDENSTVHTNYPSSIEKRMFSGMWEAADAAVQAGVQQALLEVQRELWRIPIYTDPFELAGYMGQRVGIAGYSRYGWANPRVFVLVGIEWGSDLIPVATLWG